MRDPKRIKEILGVIEQIWTKNPDLRFVQMISNACEGRTNPYHLEDEQFIKQFELRYKE